MEHPRQITAIQAAAILISTIIGVGVLPLPLFAVRAANTGAPLATLLAIGITFIGLWHITKLGMRFPRQSIIQYSEAIVGKWPSILGNVLIIIFFAFVTSMAAREFGEVVITSVLKKTPLEITVIVMLILATISSRSDITTFAYIHHFYLPVIAFPMLIFALSLKDSQLVYLLPVWGNQPSFSMLNGIITIAALLQPCFVYTIIIPAMRNPRRAMKATSWGMVIGGGLYIFTVIAALGTFGSEETSKLLWPSLELAKTTTLPGNILERLDAVFLAVWVIVVFTTLVSSYYLTIHTLSKLLRLRDHKMFSMFILPFLFAAAMFPENVLHMYRIITTVGRWGLLLTIGYPILLLILAKIRKKRGDSPGEDKQMEANG